MEEEEELKRGEKARWQKKYGSEHPFGNVAAPAARKAQDQWAMHLIKT